MPVNPGETPEQYQQRLLGAARLNLQQQVNSEGISQAAADAEFARLSALPLRDLEIASGIDPDSAEPTPVIPNEPPGEIPGNPPAAAPPAQPGELGTPPPFGGQAFNSNPFSFAAGIPNNPIVANNTLTGGQQVSPFIGNIFANLAQGDPNILGGLQAGAGFADLFFSENALGRVRDTATQQQIDDDALLAREFRGAGDRSQEAQQSLALLRANALNAGGRTSDTQRLIERRRAGLEGLTSPELQAFRERGFEGLGSGLQTALRNTGQSAAARGVQGGAAGIPNNPALQAFTRGNQALERDLLLANVAERNQRLQGLQDLIFQTEQSEFERSQTARQALESSLLNREDFEAANKAQSLDRLLNFRQQQRNDLLNRRLVNLDLSERERAGRIGSVLGGAQFGAATSGRQDALEAVRLQGQFGLDQARINAATQAQLLGLQLEFLEGQNAPFGASAGPDPGRPTTIGGVDATTLAPGTQHPTQSHLFVNANGTGWQAGQPNVNTGITQQEVIGTPIGGPDSGSFNQPNTTADGSGFGPGGQEIRRVPQFGSSAVGTSGARTRDFIRRPQRFANFGGF